MNELEGQIAEIREDLDMNTAEEDFLMPERQKVKK